MKFLENYNVEKRDSLPARAWAFIRRTWDKIKDELPARRGFALPAPPPSDASEASAVLQSATEATGAPARASMEGLFGDKLKQGEFKATVFSGGKGFEVALSQNAATGALEVRKASSDFIRRSKPNGVSATVATSGGANGVSTVATRVSQDGDSFTGALQGFVTFAPNSYWKKFALSDNVSLSDLRNIPLDKIGELCATVSPEVSQALHVRTVFSNSGYEIEALRLDKDETDPRAQKILDGFRAMTARRNGTEDVFFNRLFLTYVMRGSILAELVLQENARDFAAIVTPDPKTLHFRRIPHDVLGTEWDFYQMQNGQPVSLNVETVRYVPLNPFTDSIEGNALIPSSFFIAIFLMAILRDFKRVVQQQGYPRYDIELDLQALQNLMPSEAQEETPEGEAAFQAAAERLRDTIKSYVEDLQPDETFIHFSGVKVNAPVGALGTNSLSSIDGLFKALERMAARALKVPPLFLGITDSVSEANANRQFEAFLKDIESGQHAIENAVGDLYKLALQAQGIAARVRIRFAQMRSSERLRDAQADMTEAQLAAFQYKMGWISQDEAAKRGAKVAESDEDKPRVSLGATDAEGSTADPQLDNGVNRKSKSRVPTVGELDRAKEIFAEFAPDEADGLIFADKEEN